MTPTRHADDRWITEAARVSIEERLATSGQPEDWAQVLARAAEQDQ